jgi:pimeloyl-ACP methyl ester carboxylesterase
MTLALSGAQAQQDANKKEEKKAEMGQHEYATVNGVKLHYVTQGKGQVILFLHGFPEFWYEWKNQITEFGKDYQAIALDMRGYNLSDKPAKVEDYAIPLLVGDIKAFLDSDGGGQNLAVEQEV